MMMQMVYILIVYNVFHVQIAELKQFPDFASCQNAKVTTPIAGLGNWSACEQRWALPPAKARAPK